MGVFELGRLKRLLIMGLYGRRSEI
jgi:hypothetical protein